METSLRVDPSIPTFAVRSPSSLEKNHALGRLMKTGSDGYICISPATKYTDTHTRRPSSGSYAKCPLPRRREKRQALIARRSLSLERHNRERNAKENGYSGNPSNIEFYRGRSWGQILVNREVSKVPGDGPETDEDFAKVVDSFVTDEEGDDEVLETISSGLDDTDNTPEGEENYDMRDSIELVAQEATASSAVDTSELDMDEFMGYSKKRRHQHMVRSSIIEEIRHLIHGDTAYIKYSRSIPPYELELLREIATKEFGLCVEEDTSDLYVYKKLAVETFPHSSPRNYELSVDLFVNVNDKPSLSFNAPSYLHRLSSFNGRRRSMLLQLATTPTVDIPVEEGCGGVYMMKALMDNQEIAMFKPVEEEKFQREGIYKGEGAIREEIAYVLDSLYDGFSGVPPTTVARLKGGLPGAVQQYMRSNKGSLEDFGSLPASLEEASQIISVQEIQKIAALDIRLFNTDRHLGNILLLGETAPYKLVPIDHGCTLPSWFRLSEASFGWMEYSQAKAPFTAETVQYIQNIDIAKEVARLRELKLREECITTLKICTLLLKMACKEGKTLYWLGEFFMREGCMKEPSRLERMIETCCHLCGLDLCYVKNKYNEAVSHVTEGVFTRRPPSRFYTILENLFKAELEK